MSNLKVRILKLQAKRERELKAWSSSPLGIALVNAVFDAKIDKVAVQLATQNFTLGQANSVEDLIQNDDLLKAFEQFLG